MLFVHGLGRREPVPVGPDLPARSVVAVFAGHGPVHVDEAPRGSVPGGDIEAGIGGFALPGTPDQVNRNNIYYGTQFTWMPTWDMALTFRYEGRTGDGTDDQYFGGGVSFEF